uniref:Nitrate reductase molybdenum cofactor assembly chaperone n=2 Tax=Bacillales TaxID=1385 RepID=C5DAL8_GEOSW|nr:MULTISPECIES: nitrate reductase molybdenum cofactor assembly chaperone [unclassified Geobacillus]
MMDQEQMQTVFLCISHLLSYPDEEWANLLDDCLEAIHTVQNDAIVNNISTFIHHIQTISTQQRMEQYVETFDFGKKTNLYVTYMNTGEQRERGLELLQLKQRYKAAGFDTTDQELPDYLPLMLEFAAYAEQQYVVPLFETYANNIDEIRKQLAAIESPYTAIFDAIFLAFEELGVKPIPKGSV